MNITERDITEPCSNKYTNNSPKKIMIKKNITNLPLLCHGDVCSKDKFYNLEACKDDFACQNVKLINAEFS